MKPEIIKVGNITTIEGICYIMDWWFASCPGDEAYSVEELRKISDAYWPKRKKENPQTPFPYTEEKILARFSEHTESEFAKQNPWRPPEECIGVE